MKKLIFLLLSLFIVTTLCGCSDNSDTVSNTNNEAVSELVSTRNIIISEIKGSAKVKHSNNETLEAYEGMSLYDGDDVVVNTGSSLTLDIDSDKHLFAEENTHFWLTATGKENETKTIIHLETGSVLVDIKNKLNSEESFDVATSSTSMCVRGTVFRVSLLEGKDDSSFNLVQVFDGTVWSNIEETGENITLTHGQCAIVDNESSETGNAKIVHLEEINDEFKERTGLNLSLEKAEDGEEGALKISLDDIPVETISKLIEITEDGRELCFESKELNEVKETKENNTHTHNYVQTSYVAPTCTKVGSRTMTCSICGDANTIVLDMIPHTLETLAGYGATCTKNGLTDGTKCSVCDTIITPQNTINAHGHRETISDGRKVCSICNEFLGYDEDVAYILDKEKDGSGITLGASPTSSSVNNGSVILTYTMNNVPVIKLSDSTETNLNVDATVTVAGNGSTSWKLEYEGNVVASPSDANIYLNSIKSIADTINGYMNLKITYASSIDPTSHSNDDFSLIKQYSVNSGKVNNYALFSIKLERKFDNIYLDNKTVYYKIQLIGTGDILFTPTGIDSNSAEFYTVCTNIGSVSDVSWAPEFDKKIEIIDDSVKEVAYQCACEWYDFDY